MGNLGSHTATCRNDRCGAGDRAVRHGSVRTMTVTVVAGNPKPGSRTLAAAGALAEQITGAPADHAVDVVTLGPGLLGWGDEGVAAAVKTVQGSELVIVASP